MNTDLSLSLLLSLPTVSQRQLVAYKYHTIIFTYNMTGKYGPQQQFYSKQSQQKNIHSTAMLAYKSFKQQVTIFGENLGDLF